MTQNIPSASIGLEHGEVRDCRCFKLIETLIPNIETPEPNSLRACIFADRRLVAACGGGDCGNIVSGRLTE